MCDQPRGPATDFWPNGEPVPLPDACLKRIEQAGDLGWRLGIGFARGAGGDASLGWLVAIGFFLLWLTDSNLGRVIAAWLIQFAS